MGGALNKSDLSAACRARPMPVIGSLHFAMWRCHVGCADVAYSNRGGLNANPSVDFVDVHPLIDQFVYCLTSTFSFPLPEGDKLSPSNQKEGWFG